MTTDQVIQRLRIYAAGAAEHIEDADWYLFGSAQYDMSAARDVDLLVVCASVDDVAYVRTALEEVCLQMPLHLTLMTRREERELRFVSSQPCTQFFPGGVGTAH